MSLVIGLLLLLLVAVVFVELGVTAVDSLPSNHYAIAVQYAPSIRFHKAQNQGYCFPDNAATHYNHCVTAGYCQFTCNSDQAGIESGLYPIYYQIKDCIDGVTIMYWIWYGVQKDCLFGGRYGDWERVAVKLDTNGNPEYVQYYQHNGFYTRTWSSTEKEYGTHMKVYPGKEAHGSYHDTCCGQKWKASCFCYKKKCDSVCTGNCKYYDDSRNPDGNDGNDGAWWQTWYNLVLLSETHVASEAWMQDVGTNHFGVKHPLDRGIDLCNIDGCDEDGCDRSHLSSNQKFSG